MKAQLGVLFAIAAVGCSGVPVGADGTDSGGCQVAITWNEGDAPEDYVYQFDEDTRRMQTALYFYDVDDQGRTYKVHGNDDGVPVWYWTDEYDEHGNLLSNEHFALGVRSFDNRYEGDRLVSMAASGQGFDDSELSYYYEDDTVPDAWTRAEYDAERDGAIDEVAERFFEDGLLVDAVIESPSGDALSAWHYSYEDGVVAAVERDGGSSEEDTPDGTPDIRYSWERDDDGVVKSFTADGIDLSGDPHINGTPDRLEEYSQGCQSLVTSFPWVAHEPGPDSIGPRFRTSRL